MGSVEIIEEVWDNHFKESTKSAEKSRPNIFDFFSNLIKWPIVIVLNGINDVSLPINTSITKLKHNSTTVKLCFGNAKA